MWASGLNPTLAMCQSLLRVALQDLHHSKVLLLDIQSSGTNPNQILEQMDSKEAWLLVETFSHAGVAIEVCGQGCIRREAASDGVGWAVEEVAKAVVGGCCRLQMLLKLALAVRETAAGP